MNPNICNKCFSRIFVEKVLPPHIRTVVGDGNCNVCGGSAWFYARKDELELAKEEYANPHQS